MGDIGCQDAPDRIAAVSLDATGGRNQTYPVNSAQSRNVTYNILSAGEENSSPTEAWKQSFLKRDYYRSSIRISPATAAATTTINTSTTVSDVNACPRCHDAPHLNLPPLTKSHTERERDAVNYRFSTTKTRATAMAGRTVDSRLHDCALKQTCADLRFQRTFRAHNQLEIEPMN